MSKTDPQLKNNDCGISAIKTIFNITVKTAIQNTTVAVIK